MSRAAGSRRSPPRGPTLSKQARPPPRRGVDARPPPRRGVDAKTPPDNTNAALTREHSRLAASTLSTADALARAGFGAYCDAAAENEIAVEDLPLLDDQDLIDLGLTAIERQRFREAFPEASDAAEAPTRRGPAFRPPALLDDPLAALLWSCGIDANARAWLDAGDLDLETLAMHAEQSDFANCPAIDRGQATALLGAARALYALGLRQR